MWYVLLQTRRAGVRKLHVVGEDLVATDQLVTLVLVHAAALVVAVGSNGEPLVAVLLADRHATVARVWRATVAAAGACVRSVEGFGDEESFCWVTLEHHDVEEAGVHRHCV